MRVCRAFHKTPDEIRTVEVSDYCSMLASMVECPPVDEAFYYGFCSGGKKTQQQQTADLSSKNARREFIESLN